MSIDQWPSRLRKVEGHPVERKLHKLKNQRFASLKATAALRVCCSVTMPLYLVSALQNTHVGEVAMRAHQ